MFLLKNGTARLMEDGINQTRYKVIKRVVTELYTKISVDLLYEEYMMTHVSTDIFLDNINPVVRIAILIVIFNCRSDIMYRNSMLIFLE